VGSIPNSALAACSTASHWMKTLRNEANSVGVMSCSVDLTKPSTSARLTSTSPTLATGSAEPEHAAATMARTATRTINLFVTGKPFECGDSGYGCHTSTPLDLHENRMKMDGGGEQTSDIHISGTGMVCAAVTMGRQKERNR